MNYLLAASIGIAGAAVMFLPSMVAHLRHAESLRSVSALNALALLTLVCGMASVWFLVATGALWACATVLAMVNSKRDAQQPTAPPNGGPAVSSGDSGAVEGPPSVS